MTSLEFKKVKMPSANLGRPNCLPDIHNDTYIRAGITLTDNITAEERKWIGKGMISTLLPYQIQDNYDRSRSIKEFDAAILENEHLIATFIPELGGRLWSIYDKKEKRQLLYDNNVFQPANLALRNAWFSGGVEFNVSIKGHNPLTCSPLFAKKVYNQNGEPVLKMYEFERIRGIVYTIYATLKEDALLIHPVIENTSKKDTYMYWWSNIAVDESTDTRVIVPTEETFYCAYSDGAYLLDSCSLPMLNGKDTTYSVNSERSRDFFYKIPDENDKWLAAVKGDGKGLLHFSDEKLVGRKMFLWGQQNGGKHWNQWLTDREDGYIEVQAGLLRTQLEHFIMDKESTLSWTEGYTLATGNPEILHGDDYVAAAKEISDNSVKQRSYAFDKEIFNIVKEDELSLYGSGWGALENIVRDIPVSKNEFPENSMDFEQKYWLSVLNGGKCEKHDVSDLIDSYVVGDFWIEKLEKVADKDWYAYNQLGILYYAKGEYEKAEKAFLDSIAKENNPWALRNLAQLKKNLFEKPEEAADLMLKAIAIKSDYSPLLVDCATSLLNIGAYEKWIEVYNSFDEKTKAIGRLRMLYCLCCVKTNRLDIAKSIMTPELKIDDIKEGEYSLFAIWLELYRKEIAASKNVDETEITNEEVLEKYPLPYELDFRMH